LQTFYQHSISALWLAWLIYWCVAAINTKATHRRESVASRLSHFVPLFLGFALLVSPHLAGAWLRMRFLPRSLGWFWLGFAFVVLGLLFAVTARGWLGGNWSGTVTLKRDHELIRSGPYRFVRHPIYTGLLLALLGTAIAAGEWRGLVAFALITVAFLRKIGVEEAFLTEQFGEAYASYRAEVPALVPVWR
jgi:protein-S-isoprenylcysteine O-methyltransferase Ste14